MPCCENPSQHHHWRNQYPNLSMLYRTIQVPCVVDSDGVAMLAYTEVTDVVHTEKLIHLKPL